MSSNVLRGAALGARAHAIPVPVRLPDLPDDRPEDVLAQARQEAAHLLAQAAAEADQLREEARAQGFAMGRDAAAHDVAAALAALDELRGELDRRAGEHEAMMAGEAATLAAEIAAKLLRAELSVAPERVVDVMRGAIRRASDRTRLVARVNPADLAVCRDAASDIVERMGGIDRLQVVDDPRIGAGSCVLETTGGDVDATFESQMARVVEALRAPADPRLLGEDDGGA